MEKVVRGILFSRSVRSTFASLTLAPISATKADDELTPILVRIQFFGQIKDLRSYCRRAYKLGDMIEVRTTQGRPSHTLDEEGVEKRWNEPRLVIDLSSTEESQNYLTIQQTQFWSMKECQAWQNRFLPPKQKSTSKRKLSATNTDATGPQSTTSESEDAAASKRNHGGGLGKRLQGEHVARFLISCTMNTLAESSEEKAHLGDPSNWSTVDHKDFPSLYKQAVTLLNSGSGVLDVAGGSGHVSMGLGIRGIQSTVIDAREGVGKLPGRDRKIWNRALKKSKLPLSNDTDSMVYCLPAIPYKAHRAWFGTRPEGVETRFRHPDQQDLPVCDHASGLLQKASAIVACHPDEATGAIVEMAVQKRIPLVVVPCCVFARLFPERRVSDSDGRERPVSSYDDLLQFLCTQDSSILKSTLPFDGKNTILYSTFKKTTS